MLRRNVLPRDASPIPLNESGFSEAAERDWYRVSPGGEVVNMSEQSLLKFQTRVDGQMVHFSGA